MSAMSKSVLVWPLFSLNKEYLELVIAVVCYTLLERGLWGLVEFFKSICFLKVTISTCHLTEFLISYCSRIKYSV